MAGAGQERRWGSQRGNRRQLGASGSLWGRTASEGLFERIGLQTEGSAEGIGEVVGGLAGRLLTWSGWRRKRLGDLSIGRAVSLCGRVGAGFGGSFCLVGKRGSVKRRQGVGVEGRGDDDDEGVVVTIDASREGLDVME